MTSDKPAPVLSGLFIALAAVVALAIGARECAQGTRSVGYEVREDRVIYHAFRFKRSPLPTAVHGADPKTFQAMGAWGKDQQSVFFQGEKIPSCDPATFQVLDRDSFMTRDKDRVYVGVETYSEDADSFEILNHSYHRDSGHVFFEGRPLDGVDPATFKVLGQGDWATDGQQVIFQGKARKDIDPGTFEIFPGDLWARDRHQVFFMGQVKQGSDPASFEIFKEDETFARDQKFVYYAGDVIPAADPSSFVILANSYQKDGKNAYWGGRRVEGADVATFETTEHHAQDKNGRFEWGRRIP